jgi:uncharacterized membrane protein YbhN (UPF0104 family)
MRSTLWPILKLVGGAGILVALVVRLGADAFVDGFAAVSVGSVLAALGLGLLTTVFSAWRWCLVARGLGLRLPLATAVADCYRAVFLNSVLPAGVLGDVHRAVGYGRQIGDVGRGVRVVALERVTGQVAVVAVGLGVLLAAQPTLLLATAVDLLPGHAGTVEVVAGLTAVAVVTAWILRGPRAARIRAALRTGLSDARAGVFTRGIWPGLLLLSVATLAGYLTLFVVAARAAGSQAALGALLPLLVLGLLAMALPLNVGGWGPREGVTAVAFGSVGLGASQGLTVAVVYGVLSLIACLPGVVVLVLRAARSRQRAGSGTAGRVLPAFASGDSFALDSSGGVPRRLAPQRVHLRSRRGALGERGARTGPRGVADAVRGVPGDGLRGAAGTGLPGAGQGRAGRRWPGADPLALGVPHRRRPRFSALRLRHPAAPRTAPDLGRGTRCAALRHRA